MSAFLIGYMILAIIVLVLINALVSRNKNKSKRKNRPPVQGQQRSQMEQQDSDNEPNQQHQDNLPERVTGIEENTTPVEDHSFTEFVGDGEDDSDTNYEEQQIEKAKEESQDEPSRELSRRERRIAEERPISRKEKKGKQQAEQEDPDEIKKGPIITVIILGAFVAILNQTLMNVALPHMMNDLNVSANTAQWLTTGYMLVNGVLIPITAFLMETFTTRRLFITAMSLFAAGSLICGLSPSFPFLMAGRVVQASGAGIIMPLMMTTLFAIFPPNKRGAAMGMVGVAMIFAPAIGPTLSGYIVENYSWRLLFYIVLPIALIDIIVAVIFLKNVTRLSFPKFDFIGVILSTVGFGGILYAFSTAGNNGWHNGEVIGTLAIGIISLVSFIVRELTIDVPMLEFRVFKYPMFALTTAVSAVITMAMFAAMILVPIYLQNIRGFSPIQSGLLLLPGAILMGIMSPVTGILFDKIGARPLAIVGLLITGVTTWQFAHLTSETTYRHMIILYSFRMFGMSMLMMPIMTAGLNALPRKLNSHGTAMANTMRQVAGSLGTAFLVTVMSNRTTFHLNNFANLMTTNNASFSQHLAKINGAISYSMHLPAQAGKEIVTYLLYGLASKESAISGINDAFVVATMLVVVAFVLSLFIKRTTPPDEELQAREAGTTTQPSQSHHE